MSFYAYVCVWTILIVEHWANKRYESEILLFIMQSKFIALTHISLWFKDGCLIEALGYGKHTERTVGKLNLGHNSEIVHIRSIHSYGWQAGMAPNISKIFKLSSRTNNFLRSMIKNRSEWMKFLAWNGVIELFQIAESLNDFQQLKPILDVPRRENNDIISMFHSTPDKRLGRMSPPKLNRATRLVNLINQYFIEIV